jgi:hypothetical protein
MSADRPHQTGPLISRLLRAGQLAGAGLLAAGLAVGLATGSPASGLRLTALPSAPIGDLLVGIGLLVLVVSLVAALLTLTVGWVRQQDWRFAWLPLVVLAVLAVAAVVSR